MSTADYSGMGRLGERTPLDPPIQASMTRESAPAAKPRGLFRRGQATEQPSAGIPVLILDYSVSGIGFAAPEQIALEASEVVILQMGTSSTRVRIVAGRDVDGLSHWGAMFIDPWPELVRAIEEGVYQIDMDSEQARWNAQR